MTTPTTNITLSSIQTEFGGTNPISLSEYYRGGANVPSGQATSATDGVAISTSGTIRMGMFRTLTETSSTFLRPTSHVMNLGVTASPASAYDTATTTLDTSTWMTMFLDGVNSADTATITYSFSGGTAVSGLLTVRASMSIIETDIGGGSSGEILIEYSTNGGASWAFFNNTNVTTPTLLTESLASVVPSSLKVRCTVVVGAVGGDTTTLLVSDILFVPTTTTTITENFSSGLGAYTLQSGSLAPPFFIGTSPYGSTLVTSSVASVNSIERTFTTTRASTINFKFRLDSLGTDDACFFYVTDQYSNYRLAMTPAREGFYDSARRPMVFWQGPSGSTSSASVGTAVLSTSVWYQGTVFQSGANAVFRMTNLTTNAVVDTIMGPWQPIDAAKLRFVTDAVSSTTTSACTFADISI